MSVRVLAANRTAGYRGTLMGETPSTVAMPHVNTKVSRAPPLTCGSGPKGTRTPDLLAASQNRVNGVLTCENAGHDPAETAKLWGELPVPDRRSGVLGHRMGSVPSSSSTTQPRKERLDERHKRDVRTRTDASNRPALRSPQRVSLDEGREP